MAGEGMFFQNCLSRPIFSTAKVSPTNCLRKYLTPQALLIVGDLPLFQLFFAISRPVPPTRHQFWWVVKLSCLVGKKMGTVEIRPKKKDIYIYIHMFKNIFLCFCMITATSTCTVGGSQRPPLKRCHKKLEIHLRRRIFEQICLICVYLYFWLVNSTSSCIKQIGGP